MSDPIKYVVGFLFNAKRDHVVLIRKTKPAWQAGLLNGVGGKIEPGEESRQAMRREFLEETGVDVVPTEWIRFAELDSDVFKVYCYAAFNETAYQNAKTVESEPIRKIGIQYLHTVQYVSNIPWLISMALDNNNGKPFYAKIQY